MSAQTKRDYEFGPFRIDTAERVLLRDGKPVSLTPKAFEVLMLLVERSGHIVEKDELISRVWADSFVEEGNLKVTVSMLRKVLEEGAGAQQYIETVPRRGYRFVETVKVLGGEGAELVMREVTRSTVTIEQQEQTPPVLAGKRRIFDARVVIAGAALIPLIIAGFFLLRSRAEPRGKVRSIAILPFKPLVEESRDEALELGMAETLITRLSSVRQIIVRPTSAVRKYAGLEQDPISAGRELRVDAVLDGTIQKSGEQIRVAVRLVNVADGQQLWADKFGEKMTNIFAVQDSISERVAGALSAQLSGEERALLTKRYTDNVEAYQLYLKGRYYWNRRTEEAARKAIEYFNQAIGLDSGYALAFAGLADSYDISHALPPNQAIPIARAAAMKALEIDDKLAEAHTSLAMLSTDDWDWPEAERQFRRAIELNPNYAMAHNEYATYLVWMGRFDEAIAETKRARELDPFSLNSNTFMGWATYVSRQYDPAIAQLKEALDMDPSFAITHLDLGLVYLEKGMYKEAIAAFQKGRTLSGGDPDMVALAGYGYARSGKKSEAKKALVELTELSRHRYVPPFDQALIHIGLGEKDQAFEWLEKSYEQRSWHMGMLKVHPLFDSLRSDPRFADLLRRMGFPQ